MKNFNRILIPLDFSDYSKSAIEWAGEHFDRAEFLFLHIWYGELQAYANYHGDPMADAREALDQVVTNFKLKYDNPVTEMVVSGHPATVTCKVAEEENCDAIVMATHGRTGLKHLLVGSVTENVVRHSKIPVLTMPFGK